MAAQGFFIETFSNLVMLLLEIMMVYNIDIVGELRGNQLNNRKLK